MDNLKKFTKQDFITLFSFSCSENIENILLNKNKVGIGGGIHFTKFYKQIEQILTPGSNISGEYNELQCILKFFNYKCYEKIEFPKDCDILFSLLKFSQSAYKPLENIKKFTDSCVKVLGEDLFCETVLTYLEKNTDKEKDTKIKDNIFSKIQSGFFHPYFILTAFNILYKKHKKIEKQLLEKQLTTLLSGRINGICSLSLYKKFEKIDTYTKTSSFALQFYEYNSKNERFVNAVKKYKIECSYKDLNKNLTSNKEIHASKPKRKI